MVGVATSGLLTSVFTKLNILVDQTGHARLAALHLLSMIPDPADVPPFDPHKQLPMIAWMSPELFDPPRYGLRNSDPTKNSDCYALGMVVYEVLTGHLPFPNACNLYVIIMWVLAGKRPLRGKLFTDSLWEMLEWCWQAEPDARPSVNHVLQCLEREPPYAGPVVEDKKELGYNSDLGRFRPGLG